MNDKLEGARVGAKAPGFLAETPDGPVALDRLAARHKRLVLTSQDSYRYHPN